jgi:hypothetical protein
MLISVTLFTVSRAGARWAAFLWLFALWDIAYYAGLWATLRWPASLTGLDVLFLIPVPWIAQVWFPLLVSGLTGPRDRRLKRPTCQFWLPITLHHSHLVQLANLLHSKTVENSAKSSPPIK